MVWLRKIKTWRKSKTVYGTDTNGSKQGLMLQIMSLGRPLPTGKKIGIMKNEFGGKNHEIISWIKSAL